MMIYISEDGRIGAAYIFVECRWIAPLGILGEEWRKIKEKI